MDAHHLTLKELGYNSNNDHQEIVERLENKDIGWAYADQSMFNPKTSQPNESEKTDYKKTRHHNR